MQEGAWEGNKILLELMEPSPEPLSLGDASQDWPQPRRVTSGMGLCRGPAGP